MKKHSLVVLDVDTMGDPRVFERFKTFGSVTIYNTTQAHERAKHIGDATIVITNKVILDEEILSSSHKIGRAHV